MPTLRGNRKPGRPAAGAGPALTVAGLAAGYGDTPTQQQPQMQKQGNPYLDKTYPKLDSIKTAVVANEWFISGCSRSARTTA